MITIKNKTTNTERTLTASQVAVDGAKLRVPFVPDPSFNPADYEVILNENTVRDINGHGNERYSVEFGAAPFILYRLNGLANGNLDVMGTVSGSGGNYNTIYDTIDKNDWEKLALYAPRVQTTTSGTSFSNAIINNWDGVGVPLNFERLLTTTLLLRNCPDFNSDVFIPLLRSIGVIGFEGGAVLSSCPRFNRPIAFPELITLANGAQSAGRLLSGCTDFDQELLFPKLEEVGNVANSENFNWSLYFPSLRHIHRSGNYWMYPLPIGKNFGSDDPNNPTEIRFGTNFKQTEVVSPFRRHRENNKYIRIRYDAPQDIGAWFAQFMPFAANATVSSPPSENYHPLIDLVIHKDSLHIDLEGLVWAGHIFKSITLIDDNGNTVAFNDDNSNFIMARPGGTSTTNRTILIYKGNTLIETIARNNWARFAFYAPTLTHTTTHIAEGWTGVGVPLDFENLRISGARLLATCSNFNCEVEFGDKLKFLGGSFMRSCNDFNHDITIPADIVCKDFGHGWNSFSSKVIFKNAKLVHRNAFGVSNVIRGDLNTEELLRVANPSQNIITARFEKPQIITTMNTGTSTRAFGNRDTNSNIHNFVDIEIHKDSVSVNVANRTWAGQTFRSIRLLNDDGRYADAG